jgi:hypothetical protein
MLPFTTLLLRFSLSPIEFARAYCEAFASAAPSAPPKLLAPRLDLSNGTATAAARSCGNRVPSDQSINSAKAMNTQFYDTQVATVEYQILFTKRDSETLLEHNTTTVATAMTASGFASWKIAQFVLGDGFVRPAEWSDKELHEFAEEIDASSPPADPQKYKLRPPYLQFLQVEYQVLGTLDRKPPKYEKDEVDALRDIAEAIKKPRS